MLSWKVRTVSIIQYKKYVYSKIGQVDESDLNGLHYVVIIKYVYLQLDLFCVVIMKYVYLQLKLKSCQCSPTLL